MEPDFAYMSATELLEQYKKRTLSPVEVTEAALARIDRYNDELNAFITLTPELAMDAARKAEANYQAGEATGAVEGVPIGIKDLSLTKGVRTTMGSLLLDDWIPDEDSPDVEQLKAAGMVMLGKTNTPEFGWKGDSTNRLIGSTRNPWNLERTAGGSSGGSGAAVAAGLCPMASGSDGAGSIRIPSSFCGITGLKPSSSLVPRYPARMLPYSHIGPMARTVRDVALMLSVTGVADPRDRYSWSEGHDYLANLNPDLKGVRVAWSADLGYAEVDHEVAGIVAEAAKVFTELGCDVDDDHPDQPDPWPLMRVIFSMSQLQSHLDDLDEVRDKIDPGRFPMLEYAQSLSAADYQRVMRDWNDYYQAVREFMEGYDLLITPTMATTAFIAGEDQPREINGKSTSSLGWTGFGYPFNLTGQPAMTVPCGFTEDGLPVGLQIVGRWHADQSVLNAAAAFEEARPWADAKPNLPG